MSIPSVTLKLSTLYQALESRTATYEKMNRLHGKLDLVLSQIKRDKPDQNKDLAPLVTYEEPEEDSSEEEDYDMIEDENEMTMEEFRASVRKLKAIKDSRPKS
jgi:hypothetical protein